MKIVQIGVFTLVGLLLSTTAYAGKLVGELNNIDECILSFDAMGSNDKYMVNLNAIEMVQFKENHIKLFFGRLSVSLRQPLEIAEQFEESLTKCSKKISPIQQG